LYCTKSGWRSICFFPLEFGVELEQPSSQWEASSHVLIPEEMPQTLLTKKIMETGTTYTPLTLLSQRELALTARKTLFALQNNWST
jgi:hypothetical protein